MQSYDIIFNFVLVNIMKAKGPRAQKILKQHWVCSLPKALIAL